MCAYVLALSATMHCSYGNGSRDQEDLFQIKRTRQASRRIYTVRGKPDITLRAREEDAIEPREPTFKCLLVTEEAFRITFPERQNFNDFLPSP